ncbi:MAG: glycoside hydrolase family 140 protein [Verrucomicrobiia bacterium]
MRNLTAVTLGLLLILGTSLAASRPEFPLRVGPDGRHLVDQRGAHFFINGDTPWSLASQVSREDVEAYLKHRAALGVNSLIITIPEGFYCDGCRDEGGPRDFYGNKPFLTPNKFTTPNPQYFDHADWVIRRAADFGMQVLMAPMYTGYDSGKDTADGWYAAMVRDNSIEDCRWYGQWIGRRYREMPNLIYVLGNDRVPGAIREKIHAVAEGIRSEDPNHLMTYHAAPGHSSADVWERAKTAWLTLNGTYLYGDVWAKSLQDYQRTPPMPFFLFESRYENEGSTEKDIKGTPLQVRKQAYASVLAGSGGHHYGNGPVWHMNAAPWYPNGRAPWKAALDDPGARTLLPNIRKLFESRAWFTLVPDIGGELVVHASGAGKEPIPAARTADGATAIIYLASARTIRVDLARLSGKEIRAWWFNPRDGAAREIGRRPADGEREFTSPSEDDWVLVLDDAAREFRPPGSVNE